jgi:hypothetical protein
MVLIASTNPLTCFYHIKKFAKIFISGKKIAVKVTKCPNLGFLLYHFLPTLVFAGQ